MTEPGNQDESKAVVSSDAIIEERKYDQPDLRKHQQKVEDQPEIGDEDSEMEVARNFSSVMNGGNMSLMSRTANKSAGEKTEKPFRTLNSHPTLSVDLGCRLYGELRLGAQDRYSLDLSTLPLQKDSLIVISCQQLLADAGEYGTPPSLSPILHSRLQRKIGNTQQLRSADVGMMLEVALQSLEGTSVHKNDDGPTSVWQEQAEVKGTRERLVYITPSALPPGVCGITSTVTTNNASVFYAIQADVSHPCNFEPIAAGECLVRQTAGNEFKYFRYIHNDPSKLLTIRACPVLTEDGEFIGDPDLYVSNLMGGLCGLSRDRFQWKSTEIGADRVDIHPDDPRTRAGNKYLIGVLGYDESNVFQIDVQTSSAPSILLMAPDKGDQAVHENSISASKYHYYKVPVNCKNSTKIVIQVFTEDQKDTDTGMSLLAAHSDSVFSRGIYSKDEVRSSGTFSSPCSMCCSQETDTIRPTLFLSPVAVYPTMNDNLAKSTSLSGPVEAVIEVGEWRYHSDFCYFSIYGDLSGPISNGDHYDMNPSAEEDAKALRYKVVVKEVEERSLLPPPLKRGFEIFDSLFSNVDGGVISRQDRISIDANAISSYIYGEIDFASFGHLLISLPRSTQGTKFYDLGCGVGKAVITAALSGLGFSACIGIEILPGLQQAAQEICRKLSTDFRSEDFEISPVEVYQGDILQADWSDADIVYMSSTCFDEDLMRRICQRAIWLKSGSIILTLKPFTDFEKDFFIVKEGWYKMSWGKINVLMYQRK